MRCLDPRQAVNFFGLVVAEEVGIPSLYNLVHLSEYQPDLLFRRGVRTHFQNMPQRPEIAGPADRRGHPYRKGEVSVFFTADCFSSSMW